MSRPVKELIVDEYKRRFADVDDALVVDIRGIDANENNTLRLGLGEKSIRITVVKNTLARKALEGTSLAPLTNVLDGPAAIAYGADSVIEVARELVSWARKVQHLELKGACLDGEFFEGKEGVRKLSEFPTKDEAIGIVVQLVLSPARKIVGCTVGPGQTIVGAIKTIREKLEKGEAITKVA